MIDHSESELLLEISLYSFSFFLHLSFFLKQQSIVKNIRKINM